MEGLSALPLTCLWILTDQYLKGCTYKEYLYIDKLKYALLANVDHNVCERKLSSFFFPRAFHSWRDAPWSGTQVHYWFLLNRDHSEVLMWSCDCTFPETAVDQVGCSDHLLVILRLLLLIGLV